MGHVTQASPKRPHSLSFCILKVEIFCPLGSLKCDDVTWSCVKGKRCEEVGGKGWGREIEQRGME